MTYRHRSCFRSVRASLSGSCFFFFQAEDGIRDLTVTGVQTCALPILKEDLYVVYAGDSPDTQMPVLHAYLNPLVKWIWLGGAVVVFGTLVAMLPNRRADRKSVV